MEQAADKMRLLYEQFKQQLAKQSGLTYYDESELVDIFDYAGDVHDNYVRLEVIILGRRLFADSMDLLKRHAVLLADMGNDSFSDFVNNNDNRIEEDDVMWAIFRVRATVPKGENARNTLDGIIDKYHFEEDEEIIQFINLIRYLQQEDWLFDNIERVKEKCTYLPTMLYEIARISDSPKQMEQSISILEDLTMEEPFNADYWGLLAEIQSTTCRYKEALSSLDYAKALSPNDPDLLSLEGYVKLRMSNANDAFVVLTKAVELDPDNYSARRNLLEAAKLTGQIQRAKEIVEPLFRQDPSDADILLDMLQLWPERVGSTMSAFYDLVEEDESEAIERISQICMSIGPEIALECMRWYRSHFTVSQTTDFTFLELLYENELYEEAKEIILHRFVKLALNPHEIPVVAIMASIFARVGDYEDAIAFCQVWVNKLKQLNLKQNAYRIVARGLIVTLQDILTLLLANKTPTTEQLDKVLV